MDVTFWLQNINTTYTNPQNHKTYPHPRKTLYNQTTFYTTTTSVLEVEVYYTTKPPSADPLNHRNPAELQSYALVELPKDVRNMCWCVGHCAKTFNSSSRRVVDAQLQ